MKKIKLPKTDYVEDFYNLYHNIANSVRNEEIKIENYMYLDHQFKCNHSLSERLEIIINILDECLPNGSLDFETSTGVSRCFIVSLIINITGRGLL